MSRSEWKRRDFLKLMMTLPVGYALGCAVETRTPAQESLGRLVLALGPWSQGERERAQEFAERFLAAEHLVGLYLPESSGVIRSLAQRFPKGAMAVGELELGALPSEERELAVELVQQLYSLIEVRFEISNEPRWGECQGERTLFYVR
ncbi:MAG: hypothetical protein GY769_21200 [bacterium]|nr:hypothetical protein [bacterium]